MNRARLTATIAGLKEHASYLEQTVESLRGELEREVSQLDSTKQTLEGLETSYQHAKAPDPGPLAGMSMDQAVRRIALDCEGTIVNTSEILPILVDAGLMAEDHSNPTRSLSGILGASPIFERIAPGKFRLVAHALPEYDGPAPTEDPVSGLPDPFDEDSPF